MQSGALPNLFIKIVAANKNLLIDYRLENPTREASVFNWKLLFEMRDQGSWPVFKSLHTSYIHCDTSYSTIHFFFVSKKKKNEIMNKH